jgi:hypothetical protein
MFTLQCKVLNEELAMIVDLPNAPIAVLAFLVTCLFIVSMFGMTVYFKLSGDARRARRTLEILGGGIALYVVALISVSIFSKEYLLGRGAEKHFCELDCHLAYSITAANRVEPENPASATPVKLFLVTLRTRFDETTIGPQRGDGMLQPNAREVYILSATGERYLPTHTGGMQLNQPLRPGESYQTNFEFTVPETANELKFFVGNPEWPNSFLIGHENSPLHKKAYFDLRG